MSKLQNSIGWCDDTGNKVIGCDKVSPGCKNCYAEVGTIARVLRHRAVNPVETWGLNGTRIAVGDFTAKLRRLNKLCICNKCHELFSIPGLENAGLEFSGIVDRPLWHEECSTGTRQSFLRRIRFFADSNSDWLDERCGVSLFAEFLVEITRAENVDVLLLTKRPERFAKAMRDTVLWADQNGMEAAAKIADAWSSGKPPANVWLGVSVEDNVRLPRIELLNNIPAAVRFVSFEPLLETLNPQPSTLNQIDWAIVGYESGKGRRDPGVEAIVSVAEQCQAAGVLVYVKQDCTFKPGQQGRIPDNIWKLKQFPNQP